MDRGYRGRGLGASLLADALRRVARAGETLAVYAMVADAKDERAQAFYERFGFVRLPDAGRRLFLPMSAAVRRGGWRDPTPGPSAGLRRAL